MPDEISTRKARAIAWLADDADSDVTWMLIHLAQSRHWMKLNKPASYDLSYVRIHLDALSKREDIFHEERDKANSEIIGDSNDQSGT